MQTVNRLAVLDMAKELVQGVVDALEAGRLDEAKGKLQRIQAILDRTIANRERILGLAHWAEGHVEAASHLPFSFGEADGKTPPPRKEERPEAGT